MDPITVKWNYRGRKLRLIDTAGFQRYKDVLNNPDTGLYEPLDPGMGTVKAIRKSHIVVLCVDAMAFRMNPFSTPCNRELKMATRITQGEDKAIIIAVNKWDMVPEGEEQRVFREEILAKIQERVVMLRQCRMSKSVSAD